MTGAHKRRWKENQSVFSLIIVYNINVGAFDRFVYPIVVDDATGRYIVPLRAVFAEIVLFLTHKRQSLRLRLALSSARLILGASDGPGDGELVWGYPMT